MPVHADLYCGTPLKVQKRSSFPLGAPERGPSRMFAGAPLRGPLGCLLVTPVGHILFKELWICVMDMETRDKASSVSSKRLRDVGAMLSFLTLLGSIP